MAIEVRLGVSPPWRVPLAGSLLGAGNIPGLDLGGYNMDVHIRKTQ